MSAGHVFISHGSDNHREADEISRFIEGRGIKSWIAPRDVRPGMDYSEQLQSAIEQCLAFVVLVSETANTSPYVRAETEMAFSNNKPIFPVRQSDIKPAAGLAFFLKIRHWTNAYGDSAEASMERLALELQTLAGLTVEAAPPVPPPVSAPAPDAARPAQTPAALAAAPATRGGLPKTTLIGMAAAGLLIVLVAIALVIGLSQPAPPAPAPAPAPDGGTPPAPAPEPAPAPASEPMPTAGIDRNLIVGRWSDNSDCSDAVEFTADGRVVAEAGETASWELQGDQLVLTGGNGQQRTIRITSVDQSAIYGVNPDGSVETSQRC